MKKKDRQMVTEIDDGKIHVYAARKEGKRFLIVAIPQNDGKSIISDVRLVAPSANSHVLVSTAQEGDAGIDCEIDKKIVKDTFGFAKDTGKDVYVSEVAEDGETLWSIVPGTTRISALRKGQKMQCEYWFFG